MKSINPSQRCSHLLVDCLSVLSVVGIWPRFIEPRLLTTTRLFFESPDFKHLEGMRIAHFTDLHFHKKISSSFLAKLSKKIFSEKPDLILFSGDFLCYSRLDDGSRLKTFLEKLEAPMGSYCVLGNHDYAEYVTLLEGRIYGTSRPPNPLRAIIRAIGMMAQKKKQMSKLSPEVFAIPFHSHLISLLNETPFKLLENMTIQLPVGLNLTGLGDYSLGRFQPEAAFAKYDHRYPGLVLSHNPDTFPTLARYPGSLILAGHTHGEQIHLPGPFQKISRKLASLDYPDYTRGLWKRENKVLYVNRGVGGHKPFRFCSPPELLIIQFGKKNGK